MLAGHSNAGADLAATGQLPHSVINTNASTAAGGGATIGQHTVADSGAAGSVAAHQSSAIDQHSAVSSATSLAGQSQAHSGFDPFAQMGAESSNHGLFDAGHDSGTGVSHVDAGATSHSAIDQQLGLHG